MMKKWRRNYGQRIVPEKDEEIKKRIKRKNPINHVTVAFKKNKVIEAGNYMDMPYFEDYYLWARMIKKGCLFYNIQECLVRVRGGNEMIKRRGGINYIKHMISFEKELMRLKLINIFQFMMNIIERCFISVVPRSLRRTLYKLFLRK